MPLVTSANVACGGHAGDERSMRESVTLTRAFGVACGAHPGFRDPEHFGRRELSVTPHEAYALVREQTEFLARVARELGVTVTHVKPHGALYNMAARDAGLAEAIASATRDAGVRVLYGLAGSHLTRAAAEAGLRAVGEAFADRAYEPDGSLTSRARPGALLGAEDGVRQAVRIALKQQVTAIDGTVVSVRARTLCLHGDGPHAVELAHAIRAALSEAGVSLRAP